MELVTYNCEGNTFEVPKRYEIKGVIGQGGYGVVVNAFDSLTGTNVAIKKIFNIFEHEENYQRRILREGMSSKIFLYVYIYIYDIIVMCLHMAHVYTHVYK